MTIEGILLSRGQRLDLYHPKYFDSVSKLMDMMLSEQVYLYGFHRANHSTASVILDCKPLLRHVTSANFTLEERTIDLNIEIDDSWCVDKNILPQYAWITDDFKVAMEGLRTRYLHTLDDNTPKYISLCQNGDKIITAFSEDDLVIKQATPRFSTKNSVYFVNGLCCYPELVEDEVYGESVSLADGKSYLSNQKDRNRGVIIVDFSKSCNVRYVKINGRPSPTEEDAPSIESFTLPADVDVKNSSFLMVVDGRLYLPNEFGVLSKTTVDEKSGLVTKISRSITFDKLKYRPEYVADRKCCSGKFVAYGNGEGAADIEGHDINDKTKKVSYHLFTTHNIRIDTPDLMTAKNSFVIIFDKPNLRVIEHQCLSGTVESQFLAEPQTGGQMRRLLFGKDAAGILFDRSTRSVVEYTAEASDQTFYAGAYTVRYVKTEDLRPKVWKKYYTRAKVGDKFKYTPGHITHRIYGKNDPLNGWYFDDGVEYYERTPDPLVWNNKFLTIENVTPLEMWANYNNDMSASASMHDNKTVRGSATVIWPRYTMLDFIFESY